MVQVESGSTSSTWQWLSAPNAACGTVWDDGGGPAAAIAAGGEPAEAVQDSNGSGTCGLRANTGQAAPVVTDGLSGPCELHSAASGDSEETHVCSDRTAFPPCHGQALEAEARHQGQLSVEQDSRQRCPPDAAEATREAAMASGVGARETAHTGAAVIGADPLAAAATRQPSAEPQDAWHLHADVQVLVSWRTGSLLLHSPSRRDAPSRRTGSLLLHSPSLTHTPTTFVRLFMTIDPCGAGTGSTRCIRVL